MSSEQRKFYLLYKVIRETLVAVLVSRQISPRLIDVTHDLTHSLSILKPALKQQIRLDQFIKIAQFKTMQVSLVLVSKVFKTVNQINDYRIGRPIIKAHYLVMINRLVLLFLIVVSMIIRQSGHQSALRTWHQAQLAVLLFKVAHSYSRTNTKRSLKITREQSKELVLQSMMIRIFCHGCSLIILTSNHEVKHLA